MAWTWLVVYVALPPIVLAAFLRQERAGGRLEYGGLAAGRGTCPGAAVVGVTLAAFGAALLAGWDRALAWWPWPLTDLTAGVVGGWLATYAVGLLWFAVRDPSWRRSRIGAIALAVTAALQLVAAVRLWEDLDSGASSVLYVGALAALLVAVALAAAGEDGRAAEPYLEATM